jgi:hypothetical protein
MCYIAGGKPRGSQHTNPGSRDRTPPADNRPISLDWELYFAGYSGWWKGAAAFIRQGTEKARTLGRMYLVTDDQFNDVVLQENGRPVDGSRLLPPFESLVQQDDFLLQGIKTYGRVVRIGEQDGSPIFTFTATKSVAIGAPSEAYLRIIVSGIRETYPSMSSGDIFEYLQHAEGIHGRIPVDQLKSWIKGANTDGSHASGEF